MFWPHLLQAKLAAVAGPTHPIAQAPLRQPRRHHQLPPSFQLQPLSFRQVQCSPTRAVSLQQQLFYHGKLCLNYHYLNFIKLHPQLLDKKSHSSSKSVSIRPRLAAQSPRPPPKSMLPQPSLPISQPVKSAKYEDVIGDAGLPPMPLTPSLSGQYPLNYIFQLTIFQQKFCD